MNNIIKYLKKSYAVIFLLSIDAKAQSSEQRESAKTNVFCSTKDSKWEWLNENGKIIEISGNWVSYYKHYQGRYLLIKYFEITGGAEKISYLRNKCLETYGSQFIYAQPADSRFDRWYLLGTSNGIAAPGHFFMKYACEHCFYRNTGTFEKDYFSSGNINLKEFIENYFEKYY